jgi:hypothetical protein
MPNETTKIHFASAQIVHHAFEDVARVLEMNQKILIARLVPEAQMMAALQAVRMKAPFAVPELLVVGAVKIAVLTLTALAVPRIAQLEPVELETELTVVAMQQLLPENSQALPVPMNPIRAFLPVHPPMSPQELAVVSH